MFWRKLWHKFRLRRIGTWPPDIAVSSWSLRYLISRGGLNIIDFPRFAKQRFEVEYIEVLLNHLIAEDEAQFQRLAEAASSVGVNIVCLALNNDFTLSGSELEQECIRVDRLLRKARILGVQVVRVNPGIRGEGTDEELVRNVVMGLRRLVPVAKKMGITLALENQHFFGTDNILKVLDLVNTPWVGVCLNFSYFFPEEFDTGPIKLAPYAVHVHAKSYKFSEDGKETKINYLDRLQELKRANYRGYFSVEWEGEANKNEVKNTQRTIRLIKRCLKQVK